MRDLDRPMESFDKWDFDIFKYYEVLGDKLMLLHFGFKLFLTYGLIEKF
jgi:hypothetical protein